MIIELLKVPALFDYLSICWELGPRISCLEGFDLVFWVDCTSGWVGLLILLLFWILVVLFGCALLFSLGKVLSQVQERHICTLRVGEVHIECKFHAFFFLF